MGRCRKTIPCMCWLCNGRLRDPRTVQSHVNRERCQSVRDVTTRREQRPEHNCSADPEVQSEEQIPNCDSNTQELLRAYDLFFDEVEWGQDPAWVRNHIIFVKVLHKY